MNGRLRLTVPHMPDETATSLLSRLAARNGLSSSVGFCQDNLLRAQAVADGDPAAISRLAELAGVDPDLLFMNTFRRTSDRVRQLGKERIMSLWMARTRLRVCPACLLADASTAGLPPDTAMYGRTWWEITFIQTCPLHSLPLVDLAAERPTIHDFAASIRPHIPSLPRLVATTEPRDATALERYLIQRVRGQPGGVPLLDDLQAAVANRFCEVLGTVLLHGPRRQSHKLDQAHLRAAGAAGFGMVMDGEEAIRGFVVGLVRDSIVNGPANGGAQSALGGLYAWFSDPRRSNDQEGLCSLVREVLATNMPMKADAVVLGAPIRERHLHSIRTASIETGVHPQRLRKLLHASGYIGDDHVDRPDNLVTFPAAPCAPFLAELSGTKGLTKVAAYINAPRVQAQLLFHAGFLRPVYPCDESSKRLLAFNVNEVDALMSSLMEGAEGIDHEVEGAFSIPRSAKRVPCGAMDIVRLIQDRRVPWVGRCLNEVGYLSLRIMPDQLRPVLFPGIGISVRQAAQKLQVHYVVARRIINAGLIARCTNSVIKYKHETYIVDPTSVDNFISSYIALDELVTMLGINKFEVRSLLDDAGLRPIASTYDIGKLYYQRNIVEAVLNSRR